MARQSAAEFLSDIPDRPMPSATPKMSAADFLSDIPDRPLTPGTGEQTAGPVPTREELMRLLPTKEQIPELVGSMAGGLVRRTLPGIALSGLGAAGGEAYKQIGQKLGYVPGQPPETSGQAAQNILQAGARGIGGELLGRGIGKLFTPFSGAVTPEIQAQKVAAESVGIKPPLSTLTTSPSVQSTERMAESFPIFGSQITKQRTSALEGLRNYANNVGAKISSDKPPEVVGNLAKEAAAGFKQTFEETKNKLYTVVPMLNDIPVDTNPIASKIREILSRRSGIAEPTGMNMLKDWAEDLTSKEASHATLQSAKESTVKTFGDLRKFRTNLASKTNWDNPAMTGLKGDLQELYGTISNVLDDAASKASPEIAMGLKQANEYYQMGQNTLKSKMYNAITSASPENIHKIIINKNNPSLIQMGKEILGEDTFRDVTGQWYDATLKKAMNPDGTISPPKLARILSDNKELISEMFKDNPEMMQSMKKLTDISNLLSRGQKITQGSQTAYNQMNLYRIASEIGGALGLAFSHPGIALGAAGELGAEALASKAVGSDIGRKLLTTGYPTAGRVATRIVQPLAQLGLQNYLQPQENQ